MNVGTPRAPTIPPSHHKEWAVCPAEESQVEEEVIRVVVGVAVVEAPVVAMEVEVVVVGEVVLPVAGVALSLEPV